MTTFICFEPADAPTLDLYGYYKTATYTNQTATGFTAVVDANTRIDLTGSDLAYQSGFPISGTTTSATVFKNGSAAYAMSGFAITMEQAAIYMSQSPVTVNKSVFAGADTIVGSAFNDVLDAWGGDDTLTGGAGNDTVLGSEGRDTAVFSGNRSDYTISSHVGANGQIEFTVVDANAARDGTDTLRGVEVAKFADGSFDLTVAPQASSFGHVATTVSSAGGQVYALYEGLLGRAPDAGGLEYWADRFDHGTSARDLGQLLLSSPEGQTRTGGLSSGDFVNQLYQTTLGRPADGGGLAYWTDQIDNHGAQRIDVANSFVFSAEHVSSLQSAFDAGVFVADKQAADVARLYYTMLSRAPDAGGLQYWANQLDQGGSISDLAKAFLGTPENVSKYGGMQNGDYVDALYVNALGRPADTDGKGYWTDLLNHGTSRADLAVLLSDSAESHSVHLNQIELGWHLA
ncbi:DUF4214 domain-containing protein [Methylobacterium durans]|uniref:DUF4214 domain-containing protein n=1 Tax=Methylobacterium durans TaxID=2202825 RepID=A0A2U8W7Z3_9HYPH|nr:DUF4214 domain-containing protein [Methylobacterium durans]AWN41718.1 hypothetical protein DK389_15890 [Methylobacterium durans]